MHEITSTCLLIVSLAVLAVPQDSKPAAAPGSTAKTTDPGVHRFELERMDGAAAKLAEFQGKVLLIVNTASRCGLTPQYEALEKLHEQYAKQGFSVVAFPANDFGQQEPGTNEEIAKFCKEKYSVTFPVFAKIAVKGDQQAPLYRYLTKDSPFPGEVKWNFQKYLIDRTGRVVARFEPQVKPGDPKVTAAIEAELAKPAPAQPSEGKDNASTRPAPSGPKR